MNAVDYSRSSVFSFPSWLCEVEAEIGLQLSPITHASGRIYYVYMDDTRLARR